MPMHMMHCLQHPSLVCVCVCVCVWIGGGGYGRVVTVAEATANIPNTDLGRREWGGGGVGCS